MQKIYIGEGFWMMLSSLRITSKTKTKSERLMKWARRQTKLVGAGFNEICSMTHKQRALEMLFFIWCKHGWIERFQDEQVSSSKLHVCMYIYRASIEQLAVVPVSRRTPWPSQNSSRQSSFFPLFFFFCLAFPHRHSLLPLHSATLVCTCVLLRGRCLSYINIVHASWKLDKFQI